MTTRATTLVIGLGNPILGDDGVGWRVAHEVQTRLTDPAVEIACLALGGVALMERMAGYRRVIIIDAMATGAPLGSVLSVPLEEFPDPSSGHTASGHDTSLATALTMGRELGVPLPEEVWIVAVEVQRLYEFSVGLSPAVMAAVPAAASRVEAWLMAEPNARRGAM